jgi:hypothetical protein
VTVGPEEVAADLRRGGGGSPARWRRIWTEFFLLSHLFVFRFSGGKERD